MSPGDLAQVLCHLDKNTNLNDPNVLVGFDLSDDAGVYQISPEQALVQTIDFFTPIVDDPYLYGQIAAVNALSDVYAMGGTPLTALSIACFSCSLDTQILAEILKGGESKIKEAGAVLLGGHTVTDDEIKYGLSVTGTVHPQAILTNSGAQVGDVLILTKPIGTGIITTAIKWDLLPESELAEAASSMTTLNRAASIAMQKVGVNSCTDITGFGLLGHALEIAKASNVTLVIDSSSVPVMNHVFDLIEEEAVPGGAYSNMRYFEEWIKFDPSLKNTMKVALFDPQTSGGLMIAVSAPKAQMLLQEINRTQPDWARIIGTVIEKDQDSGYYLSVL